MSAMAELTARAGAPTSSLVTILFTDVVGSTELMSQLGDRADDVRRSLFDAMRRAVAAAPGREVKSLGDGLMAAFPSAAKAVACSVAMQQAVARLDRRERSVPLQIRVGISVGEVTCEEDDFFGTPVVEAARLCSAAAGGQVLVSDLVRSLVGSRLPQLFRSIGPARLKGLPEPVAASEVEWWLAPPEVPLPSSIALSNRSLLVGRMDAMEVMRRAVNRAESGDRQCVLVGGEPGIGKTRLAAAAAAASHAAGAVVMYGRCDPEMAVSYQPFAQALRTYVTNCSPAALRAHVWRHAGELQLLVPEVAQRLPELDAPVPGEPEADRLRLFEAVDALVTSASTEAPVVLVLDDLHWAARPTLLLLSHLVRSMEPAALLMVVTFRSTEPDRSLALTECLGELRRNRNVERLELGALDEKAVQAFLEAAGHEPETGAQELAHVLHAETGGNPFFVGELVRHLTDTGGLAVGRNGDARSGLGIPGSIRDVIRGRVSRLTPPAARVLEIASVAGTDFELDLVARVADAESLGDVLDRLDEAVRAGVILEVGGDACRYSFTHSLVRATIYTDLTATRRAALHRKVGEALEALDETRGHEDLAGLAHHFCQAAPMGVTAKAADYVLGAARRALGQVAYEQAATILEQGLAVLDDQPSPDFTRRCDLLLALAETRARFLDHAGLREASLRAAEAARAARSPERLAQAAYWYGARPVAGARDDVGIGLCHEALQALGPVAPAADRARALAVLALQQSFAGDAVAAESVAGEALTLARRTRDAEAVVFALFARYYALWGSEHAQEQIAIAEQLLHSRVITPMGWRASVDAQRLLTVPRLVLGDMKGFLSSGATVEATGRELKSFHLQALATLWRGCHALLEGRFADARACLESPVAEGVTDPNLRNSFVGQRLQLAYECGTLAELEPLLADAIERTPGLAGFRAALARSHAELGELDRAREIFDGLADENFAAVPHDLVRPAALAVLADVAALLNDTDRAATLFELMEAYSGQLVVVATGSFCSGAADRYLGMMASLDRGRAVEAEAHFRAALVLETKIGAVPLAARTRYWYARLLATGNESDRQRADSLLGEAHEVATRLGMSALASAITRQRVSM